MRVRHVLGLSRGLTAAGQPAMRRHALGFEVDLDDRWREAGFEVLTDELVGHAVVVVLDRDVVVDIDAARLPLSHLVALGRQRLQGRSVKPFVELTAARAQMLHRPPVELDELLADRLIELSETEERPIA